MINEIDQEIQEIINAARQATEGTMLAVGTHVESDFPCPDLCDTSMLSQGKDHAQALRDAAFIESVQPAKIVSLLQRMQEIIHRQLNTMDNLKAVCAFAVDDVDDVLTELGHQMPDNVIQTVSISTVPKPIPN